MLKGGEFVNEITNIANATGTYNGLTTSIATEAVVTPLIDDLNITKTANRQAWATGTLTYTITIDNQSATAYVAPVVTDTIDPTLATLVAGTVTIDGIVADPADYTFDAGTGLLTVNLSDIAATSSTVVTFQVERV